MKYRKRLYSSYSENFGEYKDFSPKLQYSLYENVYSLILPKDRAISVADLGCGKGEWLSWMNDKGYTNLVGIDVSKSELEYLAGKKVELKEGKMTEILSEVGEKFDLLHAKDVIEHLTKDEVVDFLDACLGALKENGQLWISTFNAQAPLAAATRYGDFTHEIGLTPTSIAQLLRAVGFSEISVGGYIPQNRGWKSKLRWFLYRMIGCVAELILRTRHGSSKRDYNVETYSVLPDMLAVAEKKSDKH